MKRARKPAGPGGATGVLGRDVFRGVVAACVLCASAGMLLLGGRSGNRRLSATLPLGRVPFEAWPQARFGGTRLLFANTPALAHQGFAGAAPGDFVNTLIVFPNISGGVRFTNRDQGFGPVVRDLKIVFLDGSMRVLKEDRMERGIGGSAAPENTAFVIEGLP